MALDGTHEGNPDMKVWNSAQRQMLPQKQDTKRLNHATSDKKLLVLDVGHLDMKIDMTRHNY